MKDDEQTTRTSIELPKEILRRGRSRAALEGLSFSRWLTNTLREVLDDAKEKIDKAEKGRQNG